MGQKIPIIKVSVQYDFTQRSHGQKNHMKSLEKGNKLGRPIQYALHEY